MAGRCLCSAPENNLAGHGKGVEYALQLCHFPAPKTISGAETALDFARSEWRSEQGLYCDVRDNTLHDPGQPQFKGQVHGSEQTGGNSHLIAGEFPQPPDFPCWVWDMPFPRNLEDIAKCYPKYIREVETTCPYSAITRSYICYHLVFPLDLYCYLVYFLH